MRRTGVRALIVVMKVVKVTGAKVCRNRGQVKFCTCVEYSEARDDSFISSSSSGRANLMRNYHLASHMESVRLPVVDMVPSVFVRVAL